MQISNSQQTENKEKRLITVNQFQLATIHTAELHSRSRKIYINLSGKDSIDANDLFNIERCPCCGNPAEGQNFSFFCKNSDLAQLGSSFPLFFTYSKYLIISLTLVLFTAAIPCLANNSVQDSYTDWSHEKSVNILTAANFGKNVEVTYWQPILHVIICAVLVLFYIWIIRNIKERSIEYDANMVTPSDFTIMVKNLPTDFSKSELKKHIEENFQSKDMKILLINLTFDVKDYLSCCRDIEDYKAQMFLVKNYEDKYQKPLVIKKMCRSVELQGPAECQDQISELEKQEKSLKLELKKKLAQIAFVTFESQNTARTIASEWDRSSSQILFDKVFSFFIHKRFWFKGNYIRAEMAPDQSDVNWENLSIPPSQKLLSRGLTVIIALLTLTVATGIMAGTSKWKASVYRNKENESGDSIRSATIIPSLVSIVTNFVTARLIRVFSSREKYNTWTDYNRSVFNKLIVFYMLNNIGIPMFVYSDSESEWFNPGGLAYTVFWLVIMNCCVSPIIYFIQPKGLYNKIRQVLLKRSEKNNDIRVSQKVANSIFEGPEVDLADRFANLTKIFVMTLFYAPIVPVCVPIGIFGLVFESLMFKYMLVKVHSRPKWYNSDLVIKAVEWMRWGLFMYSLGILVFYQKMRGDLWPLELFFFIAMCVYVLTPISTFCGCWMKDRTLEIIEREYQGGSKLDSFFYYLPKFGSDFMRENPVTKEDWKKKWERFVIEKDEKFYMEDEKKDNEETHVFGDKGVSKITPEKGGVENGLYPELPPLDYNSMMNNDTGIGEKNQITRKNY